VRAVTWNLFHGRDFPPTAKRPLRREFAGFLGSLDWHVALLQEAPPRWRAALARETGAESAITLTSRNFGAPVRSLIADWRPNLIKSNEGGSNQLLVRPPWRIEEVREQTIARRPERRRMLWARLAGPDGAQLAVANLHGSENGVPGDGEQVVAAAERAVEWAAELPLIFGGDLNKRPRERPDVFEQLERRFGLAPPTAPGALDHLLVRGLDLVAAPELAPAEAREVDAGGGRAITLSDHAYVASIVGVR
jgi:endonuclease/exonuclease/phosphatase family metal-dependent hydrolase